MAKFRVARNVTKREFFEFEAPDETAAKAAVRQLNFKIERGEDYDVTYLDPDAELVDELDVVGDNRFTLTGWRE